MSGSILQMQAHRPWSLPSGPWVMAQQWLDLLFAHWPIPVETMRALVPAQLPLDTWDGSAWVGVVPFRMAGVRPRLTPAVPWLSAFPELNVRTYVKVRDRGVERRLLLQLGSGEPGRRGRGALNFSIALFQRADVSG